MGRVSPVKRRIACLVVTALVSVIVVGSARAATKAAKSSPLESVVVAVVPCPTTFGVSQPERWRPATLTAVLSASAAGALSFYSNGFFTVLAPKGWACQGLTAADGGANLVVYPPGQPVPQTGPFLDGSPSVHAVSDFTGHGPGALLVCTYFPNSAAAHFFRGGVPACPAAPSGATISYPTADIATVHETSKRVGVVLYPQVDPEPPAGVNVAIETCLLPVKQAALCDAILGDYTVRAFPQPTAR